MRGVADEVQVHQSARQIIRSERNPKMSISFYWLERAGRWGLSSSNSLTNHQKLNVTQKWAFLIFGWSGVVNEVQVHWPVWPTSDVECNTKMSISLFWLKRGGGWGSSPLTSPANHQKLNVIQKWAFHFLGWRGVVDGVSVHRPAWPTSEVECNTKMSISCFWLERRGGWGLSPFTSMADHQKLNKIQKWAFYFFGWRGVADGVQVHQSARQIIRNERNLKTSISFFLAGEGWWMGFESIDQPGWSSEVEHNWNMSISFFGWRQVVDAVQVHWQAWLIIRSWT